MAPDRSTPIAVWHGTADEVRRLSVAVERNCACAVGRFGSQSETCGAHRMLADQRVLDHLLFVARTADAFVQAERRDDAGTATMSVDDAAVLDLDVVRGDASSPKASAAGPDQALAQRRQPD